jgi:hypothetical protein
MTTPDSNAVINVSDNSNVEVETNEKVKDENYEALNDGQPIIKLGKIELALVMLGY